MHNAILVFLCSLILVSCTTSKTPKKIKTPQYHFASSVFEVGHKNAVIVWEKAKNLQEATVTYTIILNDQEIVSNLKGITYTFKNLIPKTTYQGVIKATDHQNATSIASFTFKTGSNEELTEAAASSSLHQNRF